MQISSQEWTSVLKGWSSVSKVVSTFHSEEQYETAVMWLDELIDKVCEKDDPLLESLIDTLGTLIQDYEDKNISDPDCDPIGSLKYLMEEHHLKQCDLKEIGSQGVVSEIVNGKRQLNIGQIKALSKRFNVSPAVFI